jgi:hypothetical protein
VCGLRCITGRMCRKCASPWSRHSRRTVSIRRCIYGFCQSHPGEIGRSRIPGPLNSEHGHHFLRAASGEGPSPGEAGAGANARPVASSGRPARRDKCTPRRLASARHTAAPIPRSMLRRSKVQVCGCFRPLSPAADRSWHAPWSVRANKLPHCKQNKSFDAVKAKLPAIRIYRAQ